MREMMAEVLNGGLEGELDDDLGYTRYDYRNKETENSRNGFSKKTMHTSYGDLERDIPRDRKGDYEPKIVAKHQNTLSQDIEGKILSMYAKGMSTVDIESHVNELYGVDISDSTISRITDKILPIVREWQQRPFGEKWNKYPKIYELWKSNWATISTYFKYPDEVRTLIYTTNQIENFNRQMRKVTKNKSVVPTDDSLVKILYLAMMDVCKKWSQPLRNWGVIHSQLEIFFEDRLN